MPYRRVVRSKLCCALQRLDSLVHLPHAAQRDSQALSCQPPFAGCAGSLPGTPPPPPLFCRYCASLHQVESRTRDARTGNVEWRRPAVKCPFPDCSRRSPAPAPYTTPWWVTAANPPDNTEPPRRDRRGLPSHDVPPGRKKIACGFVPLNQMIRRQRMHDIFGAPFWHVAIRAAGRPRVLACRHRPLKLLAVTLPACSVIMLYRSLSSRNIMRIVAGGALHCALALQEASRTANTIHRVHDLELVFPSTTRRMIEEQPVIAERLAGSKVERSPIIALQGIRKRKTRRLEVALDADLFTPLRAQARRIHNRLANGIRRCLAGTGQFVVLPSRPVTPLAVDPCRERIQIHWLGKRLFMPFGNLWISVVAEHAVVGRLLRRNPSWSGRSYPGFIAQWPPLSAYQPSGSSIRVLRGDLCRKVRA